MKKLGSEHTEVAESYINLGLVHRRLGDLNQAKELHVRSLDIYLKKLGPEHVDVAMCYDNLGLLHRQMGNLNHHHHLNHV